MSVKEKLLAKIKAMRAEGAPALRYEQQSRLSFCKMPARPAAEEIDLDIDLDEADVADTAEEVADEACAACEKCGGWKTVGFTVPLFDIACVLAALWAFCKLFGKRGRK